MNCINGVNTLCTLISTLPLFPEESEDFLTEKFNSEFDTQLSIKQIAIILERARELVCTDKLQKCYSIGHDSYSNSLLIIFTESWGNRRYVESALDEIDVVFKGVSISLETRKIS